MSNRTEKTTVKGEQSVSAEDVATYLRGHPEFFNEHADVLRDLNVPHAAGGAISLVEKQVAVLRDQNRAHRRQLQQLMDVARGNDETLARLQQLTLRIIDGSTLGEVLNALEDSLKADFSADAAGIQFFTGGEPPACGPRAFLSVGVKAQASSELRRLLTGSQPICGRLRAEQLAELFGEHAAVIGSTALLPLSARGRLIGVLAIGSHSADRFNPDMGTTYLRHLADLIAHRIAPFMPGDAPALPA